MVDRRINGAVHEREIRIAEEPQSRCQRLRAVARDAGEESGDERASLSSMKRRCRIRRSVEFREDETNGQLAT